MDKYNEGRPYQVVSHEEKKVGRFTISLDQIEINGILHPYSYTMEEDCVIVLPVMEDRVVLIHQYRHGLNNWYWEIPAGGITERDPEMAARRELLEETGYIADTLRFVGKYPLSLGTSSSHAYLYYAKCVGKEKQNLEDTEFIDHVIEVPINQFEAMIENKEYVQVEGILIWDFYKKHMGL